MYSLHRLNMSMLEEEVTMLSKSLTAGEVTSSILARHVSGSIFECCKPAQCMMFMQGKTVNTSPHPAKQWL